MGAFSNMDYELQNSEAAVSDAFTEDDAMDMPQTVPAEPATGSFPSDTELAPATAVSEPSPKLTLVPGCIRLPGFARHSHWSPLT